MGGVIVGTYFLSIFVALLLLPSTFAELNETRYDLRHSRFKIVDESEREGSNGLGGEISDSRKETKNIPVGGSDLDVAGIMITPSESGLNYVKEVLVDQILQEITPLALPDIKAHVDSPIGTIDTRISHIELSGANVSYSDVDLGKTGITVFAGDIQARLRLHWYYEYSAAYVPFPINDGGWADVEVRMLSSTQPGSLLSMSEVVLGVFKKIKNLVSCIASWGAL